MRGKESVAMVRSVTIAAVVVGLAWPGLAGAQTSSPTTAAPRERYITVREEGKLPQRCKLLKTWHEPNGLPAFQVQAVDTGELLTIVGSGPPSAGGDPRAMSTRIFHWGSANQPPAGSPVPPTASALAAPPQPPVQPKPTPALLTSRKADTLPAPGVARPMPSQPIIAPTTVSTSKPPAPFLAQPAYPIVQGTPVPSAPRMQTTPSSQPSGNAATPQPRLVPSAGGAVVTQSPGDCCCPPPCNDCCKACESCSQPSCVCCTPSPLRQSFLSRLFKPHASCSEVVCQPTPTPTPTPSATPAKPPVPAKPTPAAPTVAKVMSQPAKPSDYRESWGKVEPWKAPPQANPDTLTKRVAPTPVPMEQPQQPDPLKAPELYRDLAMEARPANSKIPNENAPAAASNRKSRFLPMLHPAEPKPAALPAETMTAATPAPSASPSAQSPKRGIELPANEANAFWTPPEPPVPQQGPKFNGFDRSPGDPPRSNPPAMVAAPRGPMPPPGPMPMRPMGPPMPPPMPDTGVPEAMGNAFTLSGTRRPIPADFGGTPQESNGFGDAIPQMVGGQGSPPRAYGNGMPGAPRPPMYNGMPMGVNPLMSVPPSPAMPSMPVAAAPANGVPQMLSTLKDSLYPSEREWAAEQLSELNWRMQPQVVENLMKSAREDPAATVRVACVHALSHMKVNTNEAAELVQNLKDDRDPRVRQEAEEALTTLGVAVVPRDSAIQPVSHR
jgi:hypothetical protein